MLALAARIYVEGGAYGQGRLEVAGAGPLLESVRRDSHEVPGVSKIEMRHGEGQSMGILPLLLRTCCLKGPGSPWDPPQVHI